MDKKLKDFLYRSFDSDLDQEEKRLLEKALSRSKELQREKEILVFLRQNIKRSVNAPFNPGFAERVMNKIKRQNQITENEQFFDSLFVLFRPIAIAATVLIIIIAGYNMSSTSQFSIEGALGIPEVTLDDVYDSSLALVTEE